MSIEIDYIAKSDLGSLALLYKQLSKSQPDMERMGEVFDEIVKDKNYHLLEKERQTAEAEKVA